MNLRLLSLRKAAREAGIDRHTLRSWLAEVGITLPAVKRGSKILILEAELLAAIERHSAHRRTA